MKEKLDSKEKEIVLRSLSHFGLMVSAFVDSQDFVNESEKDTVIAIGHRIIDDLLRITNVNIEEFKQYYDKQSEEAVKFSVASRAIEDLINTFDIELPN